MGDLKEDSENDSYYKQAAGKRNPIQVNLNNHKHKKKKSKHGINGNNNSADQWHVYDSVGGFSHGHDTNENEANERGDHILLTPIVPDSPGAASRSGGFTTPTGSAVVYDSAYDDDKDTDKDKDDDENKNEENVIVYRGAENEASPARASVKGKPVLGLFQIK